jgi:hypothetical protein
MKTQIIPLEPHDDLISVRDKLAWAKTPRILLVWPPRGRVDLRPLDLKLLQRHAGGLGAQLGLVTRVDEMVQSAREIGLPVFRTASEAQRAAWPPAREPSLPPRRAPRTDLRASLEQARFREPAWVSHPLARLAFFALGVLAALSIAALFIPLAEIRLPVTSQTQTLNLPIAASPAFQAVSLSGEMPLHTLSLTLEGSQSTPASGIIILPQAKAGGRVTFRNLTSELVPVPAGIILQTLDSPPRRFRVTESGDVPGGLDGTLGLPVEALLPGRQGNVPAGAIQALEGALGLSLTVSNPDALTGGSDLSVRGPSASDHQRAYDLLLAKLTSQAEAALQAETQAGLFLPGALQAVVLEETYLPPAGQPGERLTLSVRVEFTASYVLRSDLEQLGAAVLDASLAPGQAAVPGTLDWEALSAPVTAPDGLSRFQLRLKRRVWQVVPPMQVVQLVQGRRPEAARRNLSSLVLAAEPEIHLAPAWWPWLPLASNRIQVVFTYP